MSWLSKAVSKPSSVVGSIVNPVGGAIEHATGLSQMDQLKIGAGIGAGAGLMHASGGAAGGASAGGGFNWSSLIAPVIGAAGDIFAANRTAQGQESANEATLTSAREQMAFQERMSDTAHQREVADLKAAGLNPVLSAGSGASTPVGASADFSNAAPNYSGIGSRAVGTALQVKQLAQDIKESNGRLNLIAAQKLREEASTEAATASARESLQNSRYRSAVADQEEMQRDFYKSHPKLMKLRTVGDALAPSVGVARDVALSYFGIKKGLDSGSRYKELPGNAGSPGVIVEPLDPSKYIK